MDCVQELMNQGILQFSRSRAMGKVSMIETIEIVYRKKKGEAPIKKIQPIVFHVPSLFPYHNFKVVPWRYNAKISVGGDEVQVPSAEIINIYGLRGMTHSGHMFAPKYTPKEVPTTVPSPQARVYVCVLTILRHLILP